MCGRIFFCALTLLFCIIYVPATMEEILSPKVINRKRLQLMEDALTSMTFRKNGKLANKHDLQPFMDTLKERYHTSKYYKTLVKAFQLGILPKLSLNENDACDPTNKQEYQDPFNKSVTDTYLKKLIFKSYDKRNEDSRRFCNYQKGLVCSDQTKRCECPSGSKMGPVSKGATVERCLLEENEVCSLIDLGHDPNSQYGALKKHLPVMILNLERPLSCKMGTQCRFKLTLRNTPHCYPVNGGPWNKGKWDLDLGEECSLGLYADTGQCRPKALGNLGGYTCFNFGPESRTMSPNVGICSHELGSYGISNSWTKSQGLENWDPMFIGFVSPATTPLRGAALLGYYKEYLTKLHLSFQSSGSLSTVSTKVGERCSVSKTEKFLESWTFFQSLEESPPQGNDYTATDKELWDKLKQVVDLTIDLKKKVCRVYAKYHYYSKINGLRCIPQAATDADGNDGKCQQISEKEDGTLLWAKNFFELRKKVSKIHEKQKNEEKNYRKDLLELETDCDPNSENNTKSSGCKRKSLDRIKRSQKFTSNSRLGMGEKCQYEMEMKIRSGGMDDVKNAGNNDLCDRTKLLECTKEGTCECLWNAEPRKMIIDHGEYQTYLNSEYCYVATGNCHPHTLRDLFYGANEMEKNEIYDHYNKKDEDKENGYENYEGGDSELDLDNCQGTNWCVFTQDNSYLEGAPPTFVCTTQNTGTTGYGPEENIKPDPGTKPKPSKPDPFDPDKETHPEDCKGEGEECESDEGSGTQKETSGMFVIITMIVALNVIGLWM